VTTSRATLKARSSSEAKAAEKAAILSAICADVDDMRHVHLADLVLKQNVERVRKAPLHDPSNRAMLDRPEALPNDAWDSI
jgi:hypothetical protein